MKLYTLALAVVISIPCISGRQKKGILDDILESHGLLRGSGPPMDGGEAPSRDAAGDQEPPAQAHNEGEDPPADGFPRGSKVTIIGLHSAVALNGQTAIVHGYDNKQGRYLLELRDGSPKEIKGTHLSIAGIDSQAPSQTAQFRPGSVPASGIPVGTSMTIFGLKSAVRLNGQQVVVKGFDDKKNRYIVQLADGSPKEVKASHLRAVPDHTIESEQPQIPAGTGAENSREPMPIMPRAESLFPVPDKSDSNGMPALPQGAKVTIVGLHSAHQLNGQTAIVHDVDVKNGRYQVELSDGSPKEIKRQNLLLPSELARVEALKNAAMSPAGQGQPLGPNNWLSGTQVLISGLVSAKELNGKVGSVRDFDDKMQRYTVVMPGGGPPKKIRARNLHLVSSSAPSAPSQAPSAPSQLQPHIQAQVAQPQVSQPQRQQGMATATAPGQVPVATAGPIVAASIAPSGQLVPGSHVLVSGLVSAPQLNGQVAVVRTFDEKTGRYIVEFPSGGKPKKIKASHLKVVDTPKMSLGSKAALVKPNQAVAQPKPQKRVSICNAYPDNGALTVFLLSPEGDNYMMLFTGLPYQQCNDVDLPDGANNATLEFTIDKFQVARQSLKGAKALKDPAASLVLVVYRKGPNTLKAAVLANTVTPRNDLYTLLMFNAYRGTDLFEMRANRGGIVQELKLNKAYRLNKEQHLAMTLTNGFHDLNIAFEPKKGRVYMAVCTGVAEGLKGQPRNLGFVLHEVGDWTASEEMSDDAKEKEVNTPPPVAALQEEEPQDSTVDVQAEKSAGTALVGQVFGPLLGLIVFQF